MQTFRRLAKPVSYALITGVLALSLHGPAARALIVLARRRAPPRTRTRNPHHALR